MTVRRCARLWLLPLALLLAAACGTGPTGPVPAAPAPSATPTPAPVRVGDRAGTFTLLPPAQWRRTGPQAAASGARIEMVFTRPAGAGTHPDTVTVRTQPSRDGALDDQVRAELRTAEGRSFAVSRTVRRVALAGSAARAYRWTVNAGGRRLVQTQVYCPRGRTTYVLTATAPDGLTAPVRRALGHTIASWRWT